MALIAHRFHSIEPDGPWESTPFPPAERRHIVQGVIGGFLMGRPRWAEDLDGNFIYGLDAKGKEMKSAPSTRTAAGRQHATKKRDPEWALGKIEHIGDSSITHHADYGRGHYQVRTRGKGLTGTAKTLKAARQIARDANRSLHSGHATKKPPAQLQHEIDEVLGTGARRYHVVVINERTGKKAYMTAIPVTHREGTTILRKITDYPWRRKQLEEVA